MKNAKYLLIPIAVYLAVSFIVWDLRPIKWDEGARFGFVLATGLMLIVSIGANQK